MFLWLFVIACLVVLPVFRLLVCLSFVVFVIGVPVYYLFTFFGLLVCLFVVEAGCFVFAYYLFLCGVACFG